MDKIDQKSTEDKLDEISLRELILDIQKWWKFLLNRWLIIFIAGILGGAIGICYSLLKKPTYKAVLTFALEDDKSAGSSGALGLASQFGINVGGAGGGGAFAGDNLLEFMKSRTIIEKAMLTPDTINGKRETLAEYYIDFNKIRQGWKNKPELMNMHFLPDYDRAKFTFKQDSLLGEFYKGLIANNITVDKLDKKLSIIMLTVKSIDEVFSKKFTERLAKVVSDFYIQTKTQKSSNNVRKLQGQVDSLRRNLNGAIESVAASTDINPNPNPSLQVLRVPSQRRQIDVQVNSTILNQLVTNLEVAKMAVLQETPLIQIIDRPIFPLEKERIGKLKTMVIMSILFSFLTGVILIIIECYKKIMY